MGAPPSEVELCVEREVPSSGGVQRVRLTHRFSPRPDGSAPSAAELQAALAQIEREFAAIAGPVSVAPSGRGTPDRELSELVETYRPRQSELLELLRSGGELSDGEFVLLEGYLASHPPTPRSAAVAPAVDPVPVTDRPLAAAPLAQDHTPSRPRPVPELLSLYRIESLKQAGAVRARRQISYEEYMALKRHYNELERRASAIPPPDRPSA